ncbi:hypothetical protein D3C80_1471350 [compost metagenome]
MALRMATLLIHDRIWYSPGVRMSRGVRMAAVVKETRLIKLSFWPSLSHQFGPCHCGKVKRRFVHPPINLKSILILMFLIKLFSVNWHDF